MELVGTSFRPPNMFPPLPIGGKGVVVVEGVVVEGGAGVSSPPFSSTEEEREDEDGDGELA